MCYAYVLNAGKYYILFISVFQKHMLIGEYLAFIEVSDVLSNEQKSQNNNINYNIYISKVFFI